MDVIYSTMLRTEQSLTEEYSATCTSVAGDVVRENNMSRQQELSYADKG